MTVMNAERPKVVNDCGCMACHYCGIVLAANGIFLPPPKPLPPPDEPPVEKPARQPSLFSEVE